MPKRRLSKWNQLCLSFQLWSYSGPKRTADVTLVDLLTETLVGTVLRIGDNFGNWCCSNHGNWHCHQGFAGYNAYSITVYSCPSGGSLSGTTCVFPAAYSAAVSYSCPVNTGIATVSGSNCVYPAAYNATANP